LSLDLEVGKAKWVWKMDYIRLSTCGVVSTVKKSPENKVQAPMQGVGGGFLIRVLGLPHKYGGSRAKKQGGRKKF